MADFDENSRDTVVSTSNRVLNCLSGSVVTFEQISHCVVRHDSDHEGLTKIKNCLDTMTKDGKVRSKEVKCGEKSLSLYWSTTSSNVSSPTHAQTDLSHEGIKSPQTDTPQRQVRSLHSPFRSPLLKRPSQSGSKCQEPQTPQSKRLKTEKSSVPVTTNKLVEEKYQMMQELNSKKETLRKLNLVKKYKAKNNLETLQRLTDKWRAGSQQAAQTLFEKSTGSQLRSMVQLLDIFKIDHELIKYSEEDDGFY